MKKAECPRIDAFELWCWRRLLRVPWTARRSNQPILKEISPGCSLEVQFSSVAQSCPTLCDPMNHSTLLLPPIPPSIRVFSNESTLCTRCPKYWSFSFQHHSLQRSPRADLLQNGWLDLLAVQGTLKSLLQHHSSKASILQHSAFFTVQLSYPYDHWKNHSLD